MGLLTAQGVADAFLFGSDLTTADAFFVPFPYRVEFISKAILKEHFGTYPRIRSYWEQVQLTDEAKSVTGFGKPYVAKMMLSSASHVRCAPTLLAAESAHHSPTKWSRRSLRSWRKRNRRWPLDFSGAGDARCTISICVVR